MSRFDSIFARSAAPLLDEQLARPITFHYDDSTSGSVRCIVGAVRGEEQQGGEGREQLRTRDVVVLDMTTLPTNTKLDLDTWFVIDGETWVVTTEVALRGQTGRVTTQRSTYRHLSRPARTKTAGEGEA